jgi:hypothetical protein
VDVCLTCSSSADGMLSHHQSHLQQTAAAA